MELTSFESGTSLELSPISIQLLNSLQLNEPRFCPLIITKFVTFGAFQTAATTEVLWTKTYGKEANGTQHNFLFQLCVFPLSPVKSLYPIPASFHLRLSEIYWDSSIKNGNELRERKLLSKGMGWKGLKVN